MAQLNKPPYTWQQPLWDLLCRQQAEQQLPHALLLSGQEGLGKQDFVRAWLAQSYGSSWEAHPDVRWLNPEKQRTSIEDIRKLSDFVSQSGATGSKTIVLTQAQALQGPAANAFLKTLEEPAGNTTIWLIAHTHQKIWQTIASRCVALNMNVPSFTQAVHYLAEQKIENPAIWVHLAGGTPLMAKQYVAHFESKNGLKAAFRQCLQVYDANVAISTIVDTLWKHPAIGLQLWAFCQQSLYRESLGQPCPVMHALGLSNRLPSLSSERIWPMVEAALALRQQQLLRPELVTALQLKALLLKARASIGQPVA